MQKSPTSVPKRTLNSSGDVLWSFYLFPNETAADIFPKELEDGLAYREIVFNETKNFLVELIRSVAYHPKKEGGTFRDVVEFEVTEYIKVGDKYFPKVSESRLIDPGGEMLVQRHVVKDIKINSRNLDFKSFHIPEYTEVIQFSPGAKEHKLAQWGSDDKPARIFITKSGVEDEYDKYIDEMYYDIYSDKKQEEERREAENITVRVVMCLLGVTLIVGAILIRRRMERITFLQ